MSVAKSRPCNMKDKRAYLLLLLIVMVWTLELFGVQSKSFCFDYPVPVLKQVGAQTIRFLLDAAFCTGWVFLFPRGFTIAAFFIFVLFAQIAGYYEMAFDRALTLTTIQAQWVEGVVGAQFDWAYVDKPLFALMLGTLALKIWLVLRVDLCATQRGFVRWIGGVAWAGYFVVAALAMGWIDPPRKLRLFVTGDRLGMTYGFVLLWAGEAAYLNQDHLLQEAVTQRAYSTDRLSAIEPPLALRGDVVLLQVESLDWRILNHSVCGMPVTPFLNRLADEAMIFKISAPHVNGSGDTDFVMLNAVPPSPAVMTYTLARYPYCDTLPQVAGRRGYRTAAFHGNSGRFFSREYAFRRMGFDALWFLEEMRDTVGLPSSLWGIRDDAVLTFSQSLLGKPAGDGRKLHYIITLTSHQPFIYLESAQRTFLPRAESMLDRYFNSMNFVDRQLSAYVESLATGTLVIIFGDHRAMVDYGGAEGVGDRAEHVPLIIHRVGERLAARQASRNSPCAYSGELTILDAAFYIHRLFRNDDGQLNRL